MMYVIMDGFDLGIGILFPFVHDRDDRDTMVNTVAPVWDGNETWLALGASALMAAFPLAYSVILSALYLPIVLMLGGLIWRGVAFEFRFKADEAHKPFWDKAFAWGSYIATLSRASRSALSSTASRWPTVPIRAVASTGYVRLVFSRVSGLLSPMRCSARPGSS